MGGFNETVAEMRSADPKHVHDKMAHWMRFSTCGGSTGGPLAGRCTQVVLTLGRRVCVSTRGIPRAANVLSAEAQSLGGNYLALPDSHHFSPLGGHYRSLDI